MKKYEMTGNDILQLLQFTEEDIGLIAGSKGFINCAVVSSGCRLNQFEASQFEAIFKRLNIKIVKPDLSLKNNIDNNIDLFLINTCAVTEKADIETNKIIRKIVKKYPKSRLILTGCSAQLNKIKLAEIPNVKLIDNIKKTELLKITAQKFPDAVFNQKRVRPYLKIQEGCDLKCSYCIIPKARPVKWSLDVKSILNSIEEFGRRGYKEVILTGVNIGSYEDKTSALKLKDLLATIEKLKNQVKIRLSSIDPVYIDDELIEIFATGKKISNHFHIPLQSASDKILGLMDRNYSFKDYMSLAEKITAKIKDAALGTDIISGFPGETEDDFSETVNNLKKLPIYYIHAFSYSDRPATKSYFLKQKINEKQIKQRTCIIREISLQKKVEFHKRFENRTLEFLSLPGNKAISSNYIKAKIIQTDLTVAPGRLFNGKLTESKSIHSENGLSVIIENYI
ncbi:MAG: MiaB/RimO family radical SAM methylthiotransferase [bacterium]